MLDFESRDGVGRTPPSADGFGVGLEPNDAVKQRPLVTRAREGSRGESAGPRAEPAGWDATPDALGCGTENVGATGGGAESRADAGFVAIARARRDGFPPSNGGSQTSVRRLVGSTGRIRTYDPPVNSRPLYR